MGSTANRELAPAKINLALHVLGRRDDGYHELDSLVVFAEIGDTISIDMGADHAADQAADQVLSISGRFASALTDDDGVNLVAAAARLIGSGTTESALHLDKQLPVASGLGGGSADAAATLRLLNRIRYPDVSLDRLAALAETLGADVPMCLASVPLIARGKGETIRALPTMPSLPLVLVYPGAPVSTPAVFGAFRSPYDAALPSIRDGFATPAALIDWLHGTRNGLEPAAMRVAPIIGEALSGISAQPGCRLARMSGSGSTCFGIFDDIEQARSAAQSLADTHSDWWVRATRTRPT